MTPASKKPVTLKEVATAAGVHFSTVSRALNPATRDLVKPEIAARILEVAQRLSYRANSIASSLRTKRSRVVGVVVPDIASMLFPPILEGIDQALLKEGYMTIVANSANDPERHRRILAGMIERQVDGLIIASATLHDPILDEWLKNPAPIVLINRTDESGRVPAVLNDDLRGIGLAVRHLVELGHKRIAHIAGPELAVDRRQPLARLPHRLHRVRSAEDEARSRPRCGVHTRGRPRRLFGVAGQELQPHRDRRRQ